MSVRETSVKAYYSELPNFKGRQRQVLDALRMRDMTNRELSMITGLPINSITPRCKELRQAGIVIEKGKIEDLVTKKTVTLWGLADVGQLQLL